MIPRASLLAVFLLWLAYESRFSPSFFVDTVAVSLAEMQDGLDGFMAREMGPAWQTASAE